MAPHIDWLKGKPPAEDANLRIYIWKVCRVSFSRLSFVLDDFHLKSWNRKVFEELGELLEEDAPDVTPPSW